ncbi:MAG: glycosyltransferase [Chloroflexi bacterium]|nr:glycosyltransferase [Chloroflexota bacterium]
MSSRYIRIIAIIAVVIICGSLYAVSGQDTPNTADATEHVIREGDSLWAVSRIYDVTLEELLEINPDIDPYALPVGTVVQLPGAEAPVRQSVGGRSDRPLTRPSQVVTPAPAAPLEEYVIEVGDSLWAISLQFDVTLDELLAANPELDPYALSIGQRVRIPNTVAVTDTMTVVQEDGELPVLQDAAAANTEAELESIRPMREETTAPRLPDEIVASLDTLGESVAGIGESLNTEPLVEAYQPLLDEFAALDLSGLLPEETPLDDAAVDSTVDANETVSLDAIPESLLEPDLASNVETISVSVVGDREVERAELSLNDITLLTFTEAPYTYDLDTSLLQPGNYRLTFTATAPNGGTSMGNLDFEVITAEAFRIQQENIATAETEALAEEAAGPRPLVGATGPQQGLRGTDLDETVPRILLVNGEPVPFNLTFSLEDDSLSVVRPAAEDGEMSVMDIVTGPIADRLPPELVSALTQPRPELFALVIIILTITLLPQGLFTLYWMFYAWNNPDKMEEYASPKEFLEPHYSFTAILPARREEEVIKNTIKSVNDIDYPDHLKEILIMVRDEDDDGTIQQSLEAIEELQNPNVRLITFTEGPKNKPNGLNRGLRAAKNDVVCIFDAEDDPHNEIYNVINTVMVRDGADVVQSGVQLMNFKSNWFSALNCLEYFFWFKSGLHCFTREFHVTPLGGNTVFFKKEWMEEIKGWDEGCLTEDADVGIRLTLKGAKIQIVYDAKHATQEETPAAPMEFIKQRTRWNQGFYQIFLKGDWLKLPEMRQKAAAAYILLNSLLQAATIFYLPIGIYIAVTQQTPVPIAMLSWVPLYILLMQMVTNLIGIREFTRAYGQRLPFLFTLRMIVFYYPFQLMLAASAIRAVYRHVTQNQAWEKTAHSNLHRQTA